MRLGWVLLLAGVMAGCGLEEAFPCTEDTQCWAGGQGGVCEPEGFCSFPDQKCASTRRFPDFSGAQTGNCVVDGDYDTIEDEIDNCIGVVNTDQLDNDQDGFGDICDPDDDDDLVIDPDDPHPLDPTRCDDSDGDSCDDCNVGGFSDPSNDGPDLDGDGLCDPGDPDDDNDGVDDVDDIEPRNGFLCGRDEDGDLCDDCAGGGDLFGPYPNYDIRDDGPDFDKDFLCDSFDLDDDNDGVSDSNELNLTGGDPLDPRVCGIDGDGDGCDDCALGGDLFGPESNVDPDDDGPDTDGDGLCDSGDTDIDNDGVVVGDSNPFDPSVCRDQDGDGCDDCAVGADGFGVAPDADMANDGPDNDADGICDVGDLDDDNDGISDSADVDPVDPKLCADSDGDGCDDCSVGADGFGALADYDPDNDGPDFDGDGQCNSFDDDDDNDGIDDLSDLDPLDPKVCRDEDQDTCDDCSVGTDGLGEQADYDTFNDGPDADEDGVCDAVDEDADNDGVANDDDNCLAEHNPAQLDGDGDGTGDACDCDPCIPTCTDSCVDSDGDGIDDCVEAYCGSSAESQSDTCTLIADRFQLNDFITAANGSSQRLHGLIVGEEMLATAAFDTVATQIGLDLTQSACSTFRPKFGNSGVLFKLQNAHNTVISNLRIFVDVLSSPITTFSLINTRDNVLRGNRVHGYHAHAIADFGGQSNLYADNWITGGRSTGVTASAILLTRWYLEGWFNVALQKAEVRSNVITDNKHHGIWVRGFYAYIDNNTIASNDYSGVVFEQSVESCYRNNLIAYNGTSALEFSSTGAFTPNLSDNNNTDAGNCIGPLEDSAGAFQYGNSSFGNVGGECGGACSTCDCLGLDPGTHTFFEYATDPILDSSACIEEPSLESSGHDLSYSGHQLDWSMDYQGDGPEVGAREMHYGICEGVP